MSSNVDFHSKSNKLQQKLNNVITQELENTYEEGYRKGKDCDGNKECQRCKTYSVNIDCLNTLKAEITAQEDAINCYIKEIAKLRESDKEKEARNNLRINTINQLHEIINEKDTRNNRNLHQISELHYIVEKKDEFIEQLKNKIDEIQNENVKFRRANDANLIKNMFESSCNSVTWL